MQGLMSCMGNDLAENYHFHLGHRWIPNPFLFYNSGMEVCSSVKSLIYAVYIIHFLYNTQLFFKVD